jgi:hypothetical protein
MSQTILLLDFAGNRKEASFADWPAEFMTHAILEDFARAEHPVVLGEYVGGLVERVADNAPSVVVTYCAAAGIGLEVVRALRREARPPSLVMIDPLALTADEVLYEFNHILREVGGTPGAPHQITATELIEWPQKALNWVDSEMRRRFAETLGPVAFHDDFDGDAAENQPWAELIDQLVGRYSPWLRYLVLTAQVGWPTAASERDGRVVVCSAEPSPPSCTDGLSIDHRRVVPDPGGMLASRELQCVVAELMDRFGRA